MKPEGIYLKGKFFEFIKTRDQVPVSVFKNGALFLRVGPKEILEPEVEFQKRLLQYNFPIPQIIEQGEVDGKFYFIESSIGEELLGDVFWEDTKKDDKISGTHFEEILGVSKKFALAQLNTASMESDEESFYLGIHADFVINELPELKGAILTAFNMANQRTQKLPYVLTHGDLNPFNVFSTGVIDFGSNFHAPMGYDLVSNIYHTCNFPSSESGDYESTRRYEFSKEQKKRYFDELDTIFQNAGLPKLSQSVEDFIICRTIWTVTRMHRWPKIQAWRYAKFKEILKLYLKGESIMNVELR